MRAFIFYLQVSFSSYPCHNKGWNRRRMKTLDHFSVLLLFNCRRSHVRSSRSQQCLGCRQRFKCIREMREWLEGLKFLRGLWLEESIIITLHNLQGAVTTQGLLCKGGHYQFIVIKSNQSVLPKMEYDEHETCANEHALIKLQLIIKYCILSIFSCRV